ncbi:hypothetical protein BG55_16525 [Erwinia mallotivora]|uniref:Uncharacterized protein n=1 Tax=Erwinia mallotivora TaxID=69222 RepID=A0A014NL51_9GAMM|nr:hypothetical protein BG55_16525 [Erwinia mallotivora]
MLTTPGFGPGLGGYGDGEQRRVLTLCPARVMPVKESVCRDGGNNGANSGRFLNDIALFIAMTPLVTKQSCRLSGLEVP